MCLLVLRIISEHIYVGVDLVAKSCQTFLAPLVSFVAGISQARILEWVAISFSKGSSPPKDRTRVISCIKCRFFTADPPGKSY